MTLSDVSGVLVLSSFGFNCVFCSCVSISGGACPRRIGGSGEFLAESVSFAKNPVDFR